MSRDLKVWGGNVINHGLQYRVIVAATSQRKAVLAINKHLAYSGMTLYDLRLHWSVTHNEAEIELALASPNQAVVAPQY